MDLRDFAEFLEDTNESMISRTKLINMIMEIKEDWSYILRAFLICSNTKNIEVNYLFQKVDYMIRHKNNMHGFMDYARTAIYFQLKSYLSKGD